MPYADLRRLTRKVKTRLSQVGLALRGLTPTYAEGKDKIGPSWQQLPEDPNQLPNLSFPFGPSFRRAPSWVNLLSSFRL